MVTGTLRGFDENGRPLVHVAGRRSKKPLVARTTIKLDPSMIWREVWLRYEDCDPTKPIIVGPDAKLIIEAGEELELRCGKASILLTQDGRVLIRGTYLSSRSSGVNRIRGGSVQIN